MVEKGGGSAWGEGVLERSGGEWISRWVGVVVGVISCTGNIHSITFYTWKWGQRSVGQRVWERRGAAILLLPCLTDETFHLCNWEPVDNNVCRIYVSVQSNIMASM